MLRSHHANIRYLYLIKLAKWLMLVMPIATLFYVDNGLTSFEILLLQAVYSMSVACMEIPSGYMADIIGRRTSLLLGAVLGTIGFAVYAGSNTVTGFLLAEVTLGLGGSFISGSDSALLFDSLAADGEEQQYLRLEGRITSLGNLAETTAAVIGGLIAAMAGYRSVYACQACIAAVAIPAALLLVEPPRERLAATPGIGQILEISRQALIGKPALAAAIWFSAVVGAATLCMAWTAQIFFVAHGLDERSITPLWVVLNLTVGLVASQTARIEQAMGRLPALISIAVVIPLGYLLLGILPLLPALAVLLLFYAVRGYATPLLKDLINHQCSSASRATVLSIRSLIVRIGFSILGPLIGWLSGASSLGIALISAGIALSLAVLISGAFLARTL